MLKFLVAIVFAWAAWRLWRGNPARIYPLIGRRGDKAAARALLGVGQDADAATIRAAHRAHVARAHPDRGGSDEATRRLNAARDLLLDRRNGRG